MSINIMCYGVNVLNTSQLILDGQLSSTTKNSTDTTAIKVTQNSSTNHYHDNGCKAESLPVTKQQVVMRRSTNEAREQKERPLSISQRIKQLQLNAGLDKDIENAHKRQNRPFTAIGNVK